MTIQAGQCDDAVGFQRGLGRDFDRAGLKTEGTVRGAHVDTAKLEELADGAACLGPKGASGASSARLQLRKNLAPGDRSRDVCAER